MSKKKTNTSLLTPAKETQTLDEAPRVKYYVFAKNCTNDHGHFKKGDKSRGAFSQDLIQSYLQSGILVDGDN